MASRYARPAQVQQFVRERLGGAPIALFLDRDGAVARRLGLGGYPQYVVLDARGRRVGRLVDALADALRLVRDRSAS